jgi:hypothetical protein
MKQQVFKASIGGIVGMHCEDGDPVNTLLRVLALKIPVKLDTGTVMLTYDGTPLFIAQKL